MACLRISWGKRIEQGSGILVRLSKTGEIVAWNATTKQFDSSIQYEMPAELRSEPRRFRLFVFGASYQKETRENQRQFCQGNMNSPQYICATRSEQECWFALAFRPGPGLGNINVGTIPEQTDARCLLIPNPKTITTEPTIQEPPPPSEPPAKPDTDSGTTTPPDVPAPPELPTESQNESKQDSPTPPCNLGETRQCSDFGGCTPNGQGGYDCKGTCKAGVQACSKTGTWSKCVDEIAPNVEVCDGRDNNCNGIVDDGLSNCSLPCAPPCVATLAGNGRTGSTDGKGTNAQFFTPKALVVDSKGNVFVTDTNNHLIRKITPDGTVTTFAGSGVQGSADGNGTNAEFRFPSGISIDLQDNLYIADTENHTIRQINPQGTVSTIIGKANESGNVDGFLTRARLKLPQGIIFLPNNGLFIADTGNHIIRKIERKIGAWNLQTVAGGGKFGWQDDTNGLQALFDTPIGLTSDGTALYVADSANHRIRRILLSTGSVSTVAGNGTKGFKDDKPLSGQLHNPSGIVFARNKQFYIADTFNTRIRKLKISLINKDLSTAAGTFNQGHQDGPASQAQFDFPQGIAIGKQGQLYIADTDNHRIRVFYP